LGISYWSKLRVVYSIGMYPPERRNRSTPKVKIPWPSRLAPLRGAQGISTESVLIPKC